ncbi:YeiH family protein [soil metagenome]
MPSAPGSAATPRPQKSDRARGWLRLAPGLLLCAGAVVLALGVRQIVPTVSPLLVTILIGALLANTVKLPPVVLPGLAFSAKRLLRLGVVLLGVQLLLSDITDLGIGLLGMVVAVVCVGIFGTLLIGRWLGVPPGQRLLIACGFSICGAAAVAAADGVIDAEEEDVVTAIALVVIFGTLMIPILPLAASLIGLPSEQAGVWAGGSIHEVAQVVAVGGALGGGALGAAVVVKLARVLMLAPVLTVLSWQQQRWTARPAGASAPPLVPLFVVGFLAMTVLRSTGVLSESVIEMAQVAQTVLLSAAMFALGCSVRVATMRRVGLRSFLLAALSTLLVTFTALAGVLLAT